MSAADPKNYLWKRIESLMGDGARTIDQVVSRTGISRGSIQRVREGKTSTGMDILVQLAEAFDLEVWELLRPPLDEAGEATPRTPEMRPPILALAEPDSLRTALFTVGDAIKEADPETRGDVLKMLDLFLSSPKSNAGQLPLIVDRLLGELRRKQPNDNKKAA